MGQPIPAQHPSVVLRSQFNLVRTLLAIAMVAVLALATVVVILANDEDQVSGGAASAGAIPSRGTNYGGFNPATGRPDAAPLPRSEPQLPAGTRYDGGPEEGTRGGATSVQPQTAPGARYDGGPEEGTRGARSYYESPTQRSSYQPAPADGFKDRAGGPTVIPQGPGAR
jgi:hypothetical protein